MARRVGPTTPLWRQCLGHTWPPTEHDSIRLDDAALDTWQTIHQTLRAFVVD